MKLQELKESGDKSTDDISPRVKAWIEQTRDGLTHKITWFKKELDGNVASHWKDWGKEYADSLKKELTAPVLPADARQEIETLLDEFVSVCKAKVQSSAKKYDPSIGQQATSADVGKSVCYKAGGIEQYGKLKSVSGSSCTIESRDSKRGESFTTTQPLRGVTLS